MSLRVKLILYLIIIHLIFVGVAAGLLLHKRIWLIAVEAIFIISFGAGLKLLGNIFGPLDLIRTGAQFINDRDFTTRFRTVGQPEMDQLVEIYNKMIDHLRDERTRLQEQNYFLDKILTASPSGIITLDFDHRIVSVNPSAARMLQLPASELLNSELTEFDMPFLQALAALPIGESAVLPLSARRRVKCQRSQFLDRGFTREFLILEELTEELRQTEKAAYEKLIRMMSHEVNNSLGAANSLLHSCLNYKDQLRAEDQEDFAMALNVVIARTDRLNAFMKSFADVVRLPAPHPQPCNVQELLKEVEMLTRAERERCRINWAWDIEDELGEINFDRVQMEQVFVNVVKNAIEAIGTDGCITARLREQNGRAIIIVEDTGNGITKEVCANLFTPFYTTKQHGQGLGLTIVREILDQHNFDFTLESRPGQPTQFIIYC